MRTGSAGDKVRRRGAENPEDIQDIRQPAHPAHPCRLDSSLALPRGKYAQLCVNVHACALVIARDVS